MNDKEYELKMETDVKKIKKNVVLLLEEYGELKRRKEVGIELDENESSLVSSVKKHLVVLTKDEYNVLLLSYIDNEEELFDYTVRHKLQLSERTYYRLKDRGLMKLYEILPSSLFDVI